MNIITLSLYENDSLPLSLPSLLISISLPPSLSSAPPEAVSLIQPSLHLGNC